LQLAQNYLINCTDQTEVGLLLSPHTYLILLRGPRQWSRSCFIPHLQR